MGLTGLPSLDDLFSKVLHDEEVWKSCQEYTLKTILLEYINEPRFQRVVTEKRQFDDSEKKASTKSLLGPLYTRKQETSVLQTVCKKVVIYIETIVTNKTQIQDPFFKRCLLKFYNDNILDPQQYHYWKKLEIFEDLISLFMKSVNFEHKKTDVSSMTGNILQNCISVFIEILCRMILEANTAISKPLVKRLSEFTSQKNKQIKITSRSSLFIDEHIKITDTVKFSNNQLPSFKMNEITHIQSFAKLFNLNTVELENEIRNMKSIIRNDIYDLEIAYNKEELSKDQGMYRKENFKNINHYYAWKDTESKQLKKLFKQNEHTMKPETNPHVFIPPNPEEIYLKLLIQILKFENPFKLEVSMSLSSFARFLLEKCSKVWRLELDSTKKSLLYSAFNLSIFSSNDVDMSHLRVMFDYLSVTKEDQDTWNDLDLDCWAMNVNHTFNQLIKSISNSLGQIFKFQHTANFSTSLSIYYDIIESCTLFKNIMSERNIVENLTKNIFTPIILKNARMFYFQELNQQEMTSFYTLEQFLMNVLDGLEKLQKRFPKKLLGIIDISATAQSCVLKMVGENLNSLMINIKSVNKMNCPLGSDYVTFEELQSTYRNINQVKLHYTLLFGANSFPFSFEDFFFADLLKFVDDTGKSIDEGFQNAYINNEWLPINGEQRYSLATADMLKMITQFLNLLLNTFDKSSIQIGLLFTRLFKYITNSIDRYCNKIFQKIQKFLQTNKYSKLKTLENSKGNIKMKRSSMWILDGMRDVLSSKLTEKVIESFPEEFNFQSQVCVMMNDMNEFLQAISRLQEEFNLNDLSKQINSSKELHKLLKTSKYSFLIDNLSQVYTIRIVDASGLDVGGKQVFVTLVDPQSLFEYKTKLTKDFIWEEEFELEVNQDNGFVQLGAWSLRETKIPSFSSEEKYCLAGRSFISLDSSKFIKDGIPHNSSIRLDTRGFINIQISLENEKLDPLFYIGKCHRSLDRLIEKCISLFVDKFSLTIDKVISRESLRNVCGTNGILRPSDNEIHEVLVPLFDYLNHNLDVLANSLTQELLLNIILECWAIVLKKSDTLLLPKLYVGASTNSSNVIDKIKQYRSESFIPNYGRPLTETEMEVVFSWLKIIGIDFFHNNGDGPSLEKLHNEQYRNLLLIPLYYEKPIRELQLEVESFIPQYVQHLEVLHQVFSVRRLFKSKKSKLLRDKNKKLEKIIERTKTLARKKTILNYSRKSQRKKTLTKIKPTFDDPDERVAFCSDIILRLLLAKGDVDFVQRILSHRAQVVHAIIKDQSLNQLINET